MTSPSSYSKQLTPPRCHSAYLPSYRGYGYHWYDSQESAHHSEDSATCLLETYLMKFHYSSSNQDVSVSGKDSLQNRIERQAFRELHRPQLFQYINPFPCGDCEEHKPSCHTDLKLVTMNRIRSNMPQYQSPTSTFLPQMIVTKNPQLHPNYGIEPQSKYEHAQLENSTKPTYSSSQSSHVFTPSNEIDSTSVCSSDTSDELREIDRLSDLSSSHHWNEELEDKSEIYKDSHSQISLSPFEPCSLSLSSTSSQLSLFSSSSSTGESNRNNNIDSQLDPDTIKLCAPLISMRSESVRVPVSSHNLISHTDLRQIRESLISLVPEQSSQPDKTNELIQQMRNTSKLLQM